MNKWRIFCKNGGTLILHADDFEREYAKGCVRFIRKGNKENYIIAIFELSNITGFSRVLPDDET